MVTEQQVLTALSSVIDPDLGRDIVSLGFVKELRIDDGAVSFCVELTTPACPLKQRFQQQCETLVKALPGVESVAITMTARTRQAKAEQGPSPLDAVDAIIAVSSCKGGVGKSTVAALLARALHSQGHAVGLLDADLFGPSLPTLFNAHDVDVYMENGLIQPVELLGLKTLSFGFMLGDSPAVMRGPMVSQYVTQFLTQTNWGKLDYLIIDMPPGTGDIQLTITQQAALDGAVIVTTPQALSLVDVAKGIVMFEKVEVPVLGLVENMSYFTCDSCGKEHHLFGASTHDLKERFGLSNLARIPIIPGLSSPETIAAETLPQAIMELADNVIREVGKRRVKDVTAPIVTADEPGMLRIIWPDGTEQSLANTKVRASCTCARCVDEFSGEPLLDPMSIPAGLQVESLMPLGNYAVSITWTDGHASGIFSWEHLKQLGI